MNTPSNFSLDDTMNPVYCVGCRVHIPRAVSQQHSGKCPTCIAAEEQAQQAAIATQAQLAAIAQQQAMAQQQVVAQQANLSSQKISGLLTLIAILIAGAIIFIPVLVVQGEKQAASEQRAIELDAAIKREKGMMNLEDAQRLIDSQPDNKADQLGILQVYNSQRGSMMSASIDEIIKLYNDSKHQH